MRPSAADGETPLGALRAAARLSQPDATAAADCLRLLIQDERQRSARNEVKAYQDSVAEALAELPPRLAADLLQRVPPADAAWAVSDGFRAVPDDALCALLENLDAVYLAPILAELALGMDRPVLAARVIPRMEARHVAQAFLLLPAWGAAALTSRLGDATVAALLGALPATSAASLLERAVIVNCTLGLERAAAVLRWLGSHGDDVLGALPPPVRVRVALALARPVPNEPWGGAPPASVARALAGLPTEAQVRALVALPPTRRVAALWHMTAYDAASLLRALGRRHPLAAAALVTALNEDVLVRGEAGEVVPRRWRRRSAAVVRELRAGAGAGRSDAARALARLDATAFAGPAQLRPRRVGSDELVVRRLDGDALWAQRRSARVMDGRHHPVRVDVIELDSRRTRLRALRALSDDALVPGGNLGAIFGSASRHGARPAEEMFRRLGLVRVADEVRRTGAVAGLNGGFYVDYGHVIDARDLGIDLSSSPGLHFGEVIGWFVEDGVEVSPPVFERAAVVVDADGRHHIARVVMTGVRFHDGRHLRCPSPNAPPLDGIGLFNAEAGSRTPPDDDAHEVSVAGHRVVAVGRGGGLSIPPLGFVLRAGLTAPHALAGVRPGDLLTIDNSFTDVHGPVDQAMAAGPLLVRDGEVDLDFRAENLGTKDGRVLPLSLSRSVDTFRAARSFIMRRGHTLVLGAVSGTGLGSGAPRVSAGLTFGELACLCQDMGADEAISMDGGGSSSLVGRVAGDARVLNVPTGGADVPEGVERFVNTYWLAEEVP